MQQIICSLLHRQAPIRNVHTSGEILYLLLAPAFIFLFISSFLKAVRCYRRRKAQLVVLQVDGRACTFGLAIFT
ncbi:hypothetical protein LENED_004420 [Lentinula edodes]|uniref:Uncharacterized protein n=1 Tax=Lentinula edodes TaxID=5353 RepID=A0A1Q3E668_LENED|nr:hypothetical protein LENED_004420 [Lentinula edodes]